MSHKQKGVAANMASCKESKSPRFINYQRAPASEKSQAFVADMIQSLLAYEAAYAPRVRSRKQKDQGNFEKQATAIISDLCQDVLSDGAGLLVQRSHRVFQSRSRYQQPFLTKKVIDLINLLVAAGKVSQTLGERNPFGRNTATLLKPTKAFAQSALSSELSLSDFRKTAPQETIILKAAKGDYWDDPMLLSYSDSELTNRYRREMRLINEWLAESDIGFEYPWMIEGSVDSSDRCLSRIFVGSFDQCGRLYGGFWQPLKKDVRKAGVRIKGQPVTVLDFGQMIVRLAYARVGAEPPEGDAYAIKPFGERYREGFKTLISAMLFSAKPITKKPKGTGEKLPKQKAEVLCQRVAEAHPAISSLFHTGVGLQLMHHESEILVELMLQLRSMSIPALPIHDAVAVADTDANATREVMMSTFLRRTGITPIIRYE
jgi:hypothetical protein